MLNRAVRLPAAEGAKRTLMTHPPPGATGVDTQVLAATKSVELAPVITILLTVRVIFPVLVKITLCVMLPVPTSWLPKLRLPGSRLAAEALPVPVSGTV